MSSSHQKSEFPASIYRDTVLAQIFVDSKKYFLEPMLAIHYAHTLMLGAQGIMERHEVAACLHALDQLDLKNIRNAIYDGTFEDLFFFIERELANRCGAEIAGKMHTASGNSILIGAFCDASCATWRRRMRISSGSSRTTRYACLM